jgi:hypothetical protein
MTNEIPILNDESAAEEAFWNEDPLPMMMRDGPPKKPIYDLAERTAQFGEAIVRFAKSCT